MRYTFQLFLDVFCLVNPYFLDVFILICFGLLNVLLRDGHDIVE